MASTTIAQRQNAKLSDWLHGRFEFSILFHNQWKISFKAKCMNPLTEEDLHDRIERRSTLQKQREEILTREVTAEERELGITLERLPRVLNDEDKKNLKTITRNLNLISAEEFADHIESISDGDEWLEAKPETVLSMFGRNWDWLDHIIQWKKTVQFPNLPTAQN